MRLLRRTTIATLITITAATSLTACGSAPKAAGRRPRADRPD